MNTKTLLTVKTDKVLKQTAQDLAREMGFPLGTLVNALLKQFVRTKEIRLDISYTPTEYTASVLRDCEEEFSGKNLPKASNVAELMKGLKS